MSNKHLLTRNGHFYYRQWIPLDLRSHFDGRADITTSLRTKSKREALCLAGGIQQKYHVTFTLLRSGILSEEHQQSVMATHTPAKRKPIQPKCVRLKDLYKLFYAEKSPNWTSKTQGEFNAQFEKIVSVLGNIAADALTREQLIAGRDKLLEGLAVSTVNSYMSLISSVLRWAVQQEYLQKNRAEGLQLETHKRADEERKAYDQEDIKKIVTHLPSRDGKEPFKFWIPMIGMYSGMRREEICQLEADDIREIDGIWCFDINDGGEKNLKTKCSSRVVPLHPKLLELGFIDFLKTVPSKGNMWGFTQWKGIWGKKFGNWYSMFFNRRHITDDPLKTFHSLRHTFADSLKQLGVQEVVISELMGHANDSITTGRYGKRYQPGVLLEAVSMIDY